MPVSTSVASVVSTSASLPQHQQLVSMSAVPVSSMSLPPVGLLPSSSSILPSSLSLPHSMMGVPIEMTGGHSWADIEQFLFSEGFQSGNSSSSNMQPTTGGYAQSQSNTHSPLIGLDPPPPYTTSADTPSSAT